MRGKIIAALVSLLLVATLAACGGKKSPPPEGPPPVSDTAATPSQAPQPENVCLYLFWSRSSENAQEVLARMTRTGEKFSLAAHQVMKELPEDAAQLNATCMAPGELDPLLAEQLKDLEVGQTSFIFDYQGGAALVMRTTDRYWREGAKLYEQGDYAQAEASLRRHLELHPDATAVWQALSEALAAQGKDDQALQALDQALVYAPDSPVVLSDRGTLLARMGRQAEALQDYERAYSLVPESPLLMHNLAWALLAQGQELSRAQELAEKAVRLDPSQPRYWDTLGRIQKARGEYAQAVISLHRAASLGAENQGNQQDLTDALLQLPPEVVARLSSERADPPPAKAAPAPSPPKSKPAPFQSSDPLGAGAKPLILTQAAPSAPVRSAPHPQATVPPAQAAAPASPAPAAAPPTKEESLGKLPAPQPIVPGYYILVGSFRTTDLAAGEMRKWRQRGQAVWMEWKQVSGRGDWVRVMLGPYQKREVALGEAHAFRQKGYITSYRILGK